MCIRDRMQDDMKKLIAYSSVAHMGFVTLGIFTFNEHGIEGSIIQMISHGLVSAALFLCVGVVYDRAHTRQISFYGGLVNRMPRYAVVFMIFILASIGLPGTSGFVGEFLIILGAFKFNASLAFFTATGVILSAVYMLYLYKRVVFGVIKNKKLIRQFENRKITQKFSDHIDLIEWQYETLDEAKRISGILKERIIEGLNESR